MEYLINEKGFIFISMILALSITVLLLPLISQFIHAVKISSSYDELSINQFFIFFRNEFIEATDYEVTSERVILTLQDGRKAMFQKYNDLIVRRIDGGYEVYLRDVRDLRFTPLSYGIQTKITSIEGEQYEKTITFYE